MTTKKTKVPKARAKVPEVTYEFTTEPEDMDFRGHFASGDAAQDKELEDWIASELDRGNEAAWCYVRVTATIEVDGQRFEGWAGLGGCSYRDEKDLRQGCFDGADGYGPDLKREALENLKERLQARANPKPDLAARVALNALASFVLEGGK